MFGYVKVDSSELKVKEYEFYKGTYCGLCRAMGKCTGQCSRMTLNYDFVFLSLVRMAIEGEVAEFERKRCLAHPLKKRNSMRSNPQLELSSGAAALLSYHKLKDDLADEKGGKKLRARLLMPFASHSRKKAMKRGLAELDEKIERGLTRLSETEKSLLPSVDVPATVFGEILGEIMSYGMAERERRIAYELGKHVGRWIYIADALDDAHEDIEKGRYNPFILLYGGRLPSEAEMESIGLALKNELYAVESATDLIDTATQQNEAIMNIIKNIIYIGMPAMIEKIIAGKECKEKNKKGYIEEDERSL